MMIKLPHSPPGRHSAETAARIEVETLAFCAGIKEHRARLGFSPSARGWGYHLEGLVGKGSIDRIEKLITDCRKDGLLPVGICAAADDRRATHGLLDIEERTPEEQAGFAVEVANALAVEYRPISPWEGQECYVEMAVEKVDLVRLFEPICEKYHVPIRNTSGQEDVASRVEMLLRFKLWSEQGKRCVLLLCTDHDVHGLIIAAGEMKKLQAVAKAAGWDPSGVVIERFGLDADYINAHGLSWIENLETGGKKKDGEARDLGDEGHPDHWKRHVQDYIARFGRRKCEANALMGDMEAGRQLCRDAIEKYVSLDGLARYERKLKRARKQAVLALPNALAQALKDLKKGGK